MDSSEQYEDRELEMIREEMERKRASLADKLGALESQVVGTVQSATEAVGDAKEVVVSVKEAVAETAEAVKDSVTGTISSVKETVNDTVQAVTETFNVSRHVENYPWASMGCAVATGLTAGLLLGGRREEERSSAPGGDFDRLRASSAAAPAPATAPVKAEAPREEGLGGQVLDSLGSAWQRLSGGLQGLLVGSVLGLAREMANRSLPPAMLTDVGQFIDDLTDKLGGKTTELSRSVVNYVSETASPAEGPPAVEERPSRTTVRQQHGNGARQRTHGR